MKFNWQKIYCCLFLLLGNVLYVSNLFADNSALDVARLDLAMQEIRYGKFKEAADIWEEMSAQGNEQAQFFLATSYLQGQGRSKDLRKAEIYFKQSAKSGYFRAMHHLGLLYLLKGATAKEIDKAIAWWQKASKEGFAESQYHLGIAYYIGLGVEKNTQLAMKWLQAAHNGEYNENGSVLEMMQRKQLLDLDHKASQAAKAGPNASIPILPAFYQQYKSFSKF